MARASASGVARVVERVCWALACVAIALYLAARTDAAINGKADLARVTTAAARATTTSNDPPAAVDIVQSAAEASGLQGLLEIPSLGLRTPLYSDTSEFNLNRGAGLIAGMSVPGHGGNLGVAAHRDGIFRALENIRVGAAIEVRTASFHYVYHVTSIAIVDRTDAALLRHTDEPAITLVTCYPFRFVGPAPRRFVVRGQLDSAREATASVTPPLREKTAAI
ncbi:class D sortase [Peristeroidobacter agariperforans]|uniref:class D sortase n=1 Tax=Peristeroidobacter agariperforans TaxID=268404 RepID=UPI00101C548C|nr:class D sortase [Peristeroidobacter agariperforans]